MPKIKNEWEIEICANCLSLLANAEVWDEDGHNVAKVHAEKINTLWPIGQYKLVPNCSEECEGSFSWRDCEGCGSTLGGDRHPAVAWEFDK